NLVLLYKENPDKVVEYAEKLTKGIKHSETLVKKPLTKEWDSQLILDMVNKWKTRFDEIHGGPNQEPKFPLPNNYGFLLYYARTFNDESVRKHVDLTLTKMAF